MERMIIFPPEVEAELISLADQGDPYALGLKRLREEMATLRQEVEGREDVARAATPPVSLPTHFWVFSHMPVNMRTAIEPLVMSQAREFPSSSLTSAYRDFFCAYYALALRGEQENENISQEPRISEKVTLREESPAEEDSTDKDHPYQTIQLVCASIFLLCASAIPAWLSLGIQFISPLVAVMGMIGSVTVYAMSWAAGRELKQGITPEKE